MKDKISKPNWKIIRAFCEQKSASDADAAKHFGVSKDAIRMRRKRENWGNSTRTDHEQSEKNEQTIEAKDPLGLKYKTDTEKIISDANVIRQVALSLLVEEDESGQTITRKCKPQELKEAREALMQAHDMERRALGLESLEKPNGYISKKEEANKRASDAASGKFAPRTAPLRVVK